MSWIEASAPGKLMIVGEWAVLEPGHPAVVAAVDRRVRVAVGPSADGRIHFELPDFGIGDLVADWSDGALAWGRGISPREKKALRFLKKAVEILWTGRSSVEPFRLESRSETFEVTREGRPTKLGFGSSAAITVASVASLLRFQGKVVDSEAGRREVFKLATLVHHLAQGGAGSGFDVAASTFGGVLAYRRFDAAWLAGRLHGGALPLEIAGEHWPGHEVKPLPPFPDLEILAGWTGGSASTPGMIRQLEEWRKGSGDLFTEISSRIREVVEEFIEAWLGRDGPAVLRCVSRNRTLLRELGEVSGVHIETPPLRDLARGAESAGGAGKPSGAGGADMGIALCLSARCAESVRGAWKATGSVVPVPVRISELGFRISDRSSPAV